MWRFTAGFDLDVDPSLVEALPPFLRERLLHYGYIDVRLHRYILCCDDARFINHSNRPNISPEFGRDQYGIDIALRDIAAGEEITTRAKCNHLPVVSPAQFTLITANVRTGRAIEQNVAEADRKHRKGAPGKHASPANTEQ